MSSPIDEPARLTELQGDGSIVLGQGVAVESDGSAVRVGRGARSLTAWPESHYTMNPGGTRYTAREILAAAERQGFPVQRVPEIRREFTR